MAPSTTYRTFNIRIEQLEKLERLAKAAGTNVNAALKALIDAAPEPKKATKASREPESGR